MNHYETLGIPKTASQAEIKDAYKSLVKKYHPDIYPGDKTFAEKKIKEINNAYDVLSNYAEKQKYDAEINPGPTYTYTPPNYSYTPPRSKYSSKYSYENYKQNYKTSNYEYEKRYTDYHRSKTPNSNYTSSTTSKFDEMHENMTNNVTNIFNNLQLKNKLLVIFCIFIIYLILFIFTLMETNAILSGKRSGSILNTEETTSSQKKENVKGSYQTTYESSDKNKKTPSTSKSEKDFDINDYYTDEELKILYNQHFSTSFETFSEFKDYLEDFISENNY